jgi:8-oxo-dGTP pyrophosphatase MutT (NUDIX family)
MSGRIDPEPGARPAATVVILRDRISAPPEMLVMERSRDMRFAGGALVFPGGAVDPDDRDQAAALGSGPMVEELAARIAAIRETLEESGLAIGMARTPDRAVIGEIRQALAAGERFSRLMEQAGLAIDGEALIPFARWHPKRGEVSKAFDTRFYITRMDDDGQAASVDATENVRLFWSGAQEVIAFCDRGEGRIIYPTRRNLERLAQFASFAELAAHARATPVETVTPWIEERADGRFLCIPGHLGYPVTSEALDSAFRH